MRVTRVMCRCGVTFETSRGHTECWECRNFPGRAPAPWTAGLPPLRSWQGWFPWRAR